jgi:hypothetical protein
VVIPDWALLIILPLGVARAMMFVMNDVIIERPRAWVKSKHEKLDELLSCPWCTGLWLSIGACVFLAWDYTRPLTKWALVAFSVSLVIVMLERVIDRTPKLMDDAPFPSLPEHYAAIEAYALEHGIVLPDRRAEPPDEVRAAFAKET